MSHDETSKPSVVVVGGGFAGVGCAKELAKHDVNVTLLDRNNYHQFQPLLYQVATAELSTTDVARPLRAIFAKDDTVDVKQLTVTDIDVNTRTVTTSDGQSFTGDYLVLAAGSRPNYFHTPGADQYAFPLYSVDDATKLRSRIFEVFEEADSNPARVDQGALNIVIVGAGPTGVETAGAVADLVNQVMPTRFHDLDVKRTRIYLIDHGPVVLAAFSEKAHEYAAKKLEHKGVILKLSTGVSEVTADSVTLSDGSKIPTRTVVWAGGLQAPEMIGKVGLGQGRGGRLTAEPDLTVEDHPRVYAIGDVANIPDHDGNTLPQLGSVALQAGRWAARKHPRRPCRQAAAPVPLPRQGDHGDDRRRRGHRRGGCPPPRAARPHGVRRVARRARLADERCPPARRRLHLVGVGLPRLEPVELDHRGPGCRADRLGRRGRSSWEAIDMTERYDVIIIGSGAGGGTLAHSLADTGKRILLLERGNYLPREMDNWDPEPVFVHGKYISKDTWYDADGKPFQPQVHYNVGGATKLYGAALYRLRPQDFGEIRHVDGLSPAWPLTYDDFEPWYSEAEWLYQVHGNAGEDPTEGHRSKPYPWPAVSHEPRIQQLVGRSRGGRLPPVPRPVRHPARRGGSSQEHVHPLHVV